MKPGDLVRSVHNGEIGQVWRVIEANGRTLIVVMFGKEQLTMKKEDLESV